MQLMRLFKGTFIYGLGQIFSRTITFFLLPLYTAYLLPEDYGVFGSLAIIGMMMNGVFTLGFGGSLARKYWTLESEDERGALIWSSYAVLLLNIGLWNTVAYIFSDRLSLVLFGVPDYHSLVRITFLGTSLSASLYPLLTYLRLKEKAVLAISIYVNEVLIAVLATVYFVVEKGWGVEGLVKGGFLAQCCTTVLTLGIAFKMIPFGFQFRHLKELISVGYPFIFGLFGYYVLQSSSRYFLNHFIDLKAVGLFCVGLYFTRPIEMAVSSFLTAWPPFFTSYLNRQEEAKVLFGKVFSYYLIGMSILIAPLFTMAKVLTHFMLQANYWETWSILGLVALAQSLWGIYIISAAPFIFFKKSLWQMAIELTAGVICIGANCLFIPFFGIKGAAVGMLMGFLSAAGMGIFASRGLLKIEYEKRRIFLVLLGFFVVSALSFIPLAFDSNYLLLMGLSTGCFYIYVWMIVLASDEKGFLISKAKDYFNRKDPEIVSS